MYLNRKMSRKEVIVKKLRLLRVIKQNRDVLFTSVNNENTGKQKQQAWEKVLEKAKSLGLASADKTWQYARDKLYGLWKCRTLQKREIAHQRTPPGKKKPIFDAVDHAIMDILYKKSPGVSLLKESLENSLVKESSEVSLLKEFAGDCLLKESPDEVCLVKKSPVSCADDPDINESRGIDEDMGTSSSSGEESSNVFVPQESFLSCGVSTISRRPKSTRLRPQANARDIESLKKDLLKHEIHIKKLQAFKLERELGLPPSKFTRTLLDASKSNDLMEDENDPINDSFL